MKRNLLAVLVIAGFAALFFLAGSQPVDAFAPPPPPDHPAAGSWIWDSEEVAGTVVPQYQLPGVPEDDYALLQSQGLHINGAAQVCHPYPGGQFGWNAEVRVLTLNGWQPVPTVNQWVPDEEGQFMTCAQVGRSGVYAVFGYWEKPEGWGLVEQTCANPAPANYDLYVGPASTFSWQPVNGWNYIGGACGTNGWLHWPNLENATAGINLPVFGYYCACDSIYMDTSFVGPAIQ
jgi:hypothetical protein